MFVCVSFLAFETLGRGVCEESAVLASMFALQSPGNAFTSEAPSAHAVVEALKIHFAFPACLTDAEEKRTEEVQARRIP